MNHFDLQAGELACEDVPLATISEAVGTPVYVYSSATLERHCATPWWTPVSRTR
jgi:diaminopimelate decarboxylase